MEDLTHNSIKCQLSKEEKRMVPKITKGNTSTVIKKETILKLGKRFISLIFSL